MSRESESRENRPATSAAPNSTRRKVSASQFSIGSLLLLTIVFSIMAAAGRQFVVAMREGSSPRAVFVIFTFAAPMIVVAVMGVAHRCWRWLVRRR